MRWKPGSGSEGWSAGARDAMGVGLKGAGVGMRKIGIVTALWAIEW
jgi:hypothetical protein